jgi:hypothetical protein
MTLASTRKAGFWRQLNFSLAAAVLLCAMPVGAQLPIFVSFDAKGAGTGVGYGTRSISINQSGMVAGSYNDEGNHSHGFVRSSGGAIVEFTISGISGTNVVGMNNGGQIIGNPSPGAFDARTHAFMRNADAAIIPIYAPNALGTYVSGINNSGEIAGYFIDNQNTYHGFFRSAHGGYTTFDEPDAFEGFREGTFSSGVNDGGEIVGSYTDSDNGFHGFVRDQNGNFTSFDAPDAGGCYECGTEPTGINASGQVTGTYMNSFGSHGFFRDTAGNVTEFDVPGAMATYGSRIGDNGVVLGSWWDGSQWFGFSRAPSGQITSYGEVFPLAINSAGILTGYYADKTGTLHGFVF